MSYRHAQAYKALHTKGISTIALPYLDCIAWGQCGETLKDRPLGVHSQEMPGTEVPLG